MPARAFQFLKRSGMENVYPLIPTVLHRNTYRPRDNLAARHPHTTTIHSGEKESTTRIRCCTLTGCARFRILTQGGALRAGPGLPYVEALRAFLLFPRPGLGRREKRREIASDEYCG